MKYAAIDIGSNSIHLIVVDLYPDGHYIVVDRARDMVGLAHNTLTTGYLSESSMARGLACLSTFKRMCDSHGVTDIEAVATSAVREALNGDYFIERVREQCDIDVQIISGEEEARLIYLGARDHIDWGDRRGLIVDIGGGSVEFIVGDQESADVFLSLPLGVRRLSDAFLNGDPPRRAELKALKAHVLESLDRLPALLGRMDFEFVVGTSGTLTNLGLMAARRGGMEPSASHGLWVGLQPIKEMARALSGLLESERAAYHGVDPKRVDTIVAGAQLMKYVLRAVNKDSYVVCDFSLREGMVADHVARNVEDIRTADSKPHLRNRSVRRMLQRFNRSGGHPKDVQRLSLSLFDQLSALHGEGGEARELLKYAALLHDIGAAVHPTNHHLHSAYLVLHGELRGFTDEERRFMALVVRLHLDNCDLDADPALCALSEEDRRRVLLLSALIKLADGLDRAKSGNIEKVKVRTPKKGALSILATASVDTGLEKWAAEQKADLFRRFFGRDLRVDVRVALARADR